MMRIHEHQFTILTGSGFGFIRIADKVTRLASVFRHETPLQTCRETRSASSTKTGRLDHFHQFFGFHLECFFQSFETTGLLVAFKGFVVVGIANVFEQDKCLFNHGSL